MRIFTLLSLFALFGTLWGCTESASYKEVKQTMTTYPYSDPDPVMNPDIHYYPYHQFEGYTDVPEEKEWKVIELENKHIKLYIFPEIGGKIWGAIEKTTGQEFIYYNHAVKFRHVAMRGPWTSGGIEFNYGVIGHAPTTSSPIDYTCRKNADGSVSCFIGARDLITEADWCVEVNLEADKGYFTTKTHWENSTPLSQYYYHWMNAGYKAADDLKFCFPGTHYIGHAGDLHAWPIDDQGHHLDEYAQNNFGEYKSYHVVGEKAQFYGAYWKNSEFGSVHHSDYNDKLGMKVWVWGLSRQGMIWEDLLTDNDGQYVELQSGRLYNQPATGSMYSPFKNPSFSPYATDGWKEYWYPVKGTRDIVESNRYGALNVLRENGYLKLYFSPVEKFSDQIRVIANGTEIYNKRIEAQVLQTWSDSVKMENLDTPIKVTLGENGTLMSYSELPEETHLSRPLSIPEQYDWNSLYGRYTQGRQWMNIRVFGLAESFFKECLAIDSMYVPALNDLGELLYRKADYAGAIAMVRKSMSLDAYDPAANLIYGLANARLGKTVDAKDGFSVASYTPAYRAAALVELAKLYAKEQNWGKVRSLAQKSLNERAENTPAIQLMVLADRKLGEQTAARNLIKQTLEKTPLNHILRFEESQMYGTSADAASFMKLITNELPHETMLAIADWYESMNAWEEALTVLSYAPTSPMTLYRQAYILHRMGNEQQADQKLTEAVALSPELVAPHGLQTLAALTWAESKKGGWPTAYYLGLAQWSVGNKTKAETLMDACGDNVPFAPFYLCRAQLKHEEARWADLQRAEKLEKSWRVGMRMITYLYDHGKYSDAYNTSKTYAELYPKNYQIGMKYAQAMLSQKMYTETVEYLKQITVLPSECETSGRYIYRDACLFQALDLIQKGDYKKALEWVETSKLWLENLGAGKPYDADIDQRAEDFISAHCYKAMGQPKEAEALYRKIAASRAFASPTTLFGAYAYRQLGNSAAATGLLNNYRKSADPANFDYVTGIFSGNRAQAQQATQRMGTVKERAAWEAPSDNMNDVQLVKAVVEQLHL